MSARPEPLDGIQAREPERGDGRVLPEWARQTCGRCLYRIDGLCRVMPPLPVASPGAVEHHPDYDLVEIVPVSYTAVEDDTPACAMWVDRRSAPRAR